MTRVRFTIDDAQRAADEWGANCGPAAIAAVLGKTLDEVRPHLGDFERPGKRYTNPTLMYAALRSLGATWTATVRETSVEWPKPIIAWPKLGLVRIQWEGDWTRPGVPMRARYRHTHWVGARSAPEWDRTSGRLPGGIDVFDINCLCVGGWVSLDEWSGQVVPWLLREVEPKASGAWHQTHVLELAS